MTDPSFAADPSADARVAWWRVAARWWLIFTALALLTSVQQVVSMRAEGEPITWARAIASRVPYWYLWGALAPLVAWLGRRLPIERARLARHVLAHLALATLVSTIHATLYLASWFALGNHARAPLLTTWVQWAGGLLVSNVLAYAVILAGTLALAYHDKFRERELAASRLAEQLSTARLTALQMQLNPHFLFNAMNSIAMLVRKARNDEAVRMLAGLGQLLRHVLEESGASEVSLDEEIDFIRRYLAIEEVRFQDRLRVTIDVDADARELRVPNLVLQPLVENAIRHGIARRAGAGVVEIVARREGDRLRITVRDDGPGVGAATTAGVGLANTRARLIQRYDGAATFSLGDHPAGGAVATVDLPITRARDACPESPRPAVRA